MIHFINLSAPSPSIDKIRIYSYITLKRLVCDTARGPGGKLLRTCGDGGCPWVIAAAAELAAADTGPDVPLDEQLSSHCR